jgi:prolipoprotein diacylglyceryltransferase
VEPGPRRLILLVERSHRLRPGRLFAVYVAGYALGRFFIERLRIDYAHTIAGLRVNEWVSIVLFVAATIAVATGRSREPRNGSAEPDGSSEPTAMHSSPAPSSEAPVTPRPR